MEYTVSPEEIKRVKGMGFLQDKRYPDVFNARVITKNGKITAQQHRIIAEASEKYGSGVVTMTVRLTLEIQGVKYENIQPLIDFLAAHGLSTGGTGKRVRPVVSCKGTTCQYGLIDTFGLSEKMHKRFYEEMRGVTLPHKFKIAVGGCPNNCVKPDLNDIGIIGQRVPLPMDELCRNCKACEKTCPIHAAHVEEGKFRPDTEKCNSCGRCVKACPFTAIDCIDGYKITIGGRWGKRVAQGNALHKIFTSEEEVVKTVEKAILFFRDQGIPGERFSDTIARVGFDCAEKMILSDELLERKDEILAKTL